MINLFETDWDLVRNTAIVGAVKSRDEIFNQIRDHASKMYGDKYQEKVITDELIEKLSNDQSQEFNEIFMQHSPNEDRKYTYTAIDQGLVTKHSDAIPILLSQAKPMKHIIVMSLEKPSDLPKDLSNSVFGNTANYIIGSLSSKDKTLIAEITGNKDLFNDKYQLVVSRVAQNGQFIFQKIQ